MSNKTEKEKMKDRVRKRAERYRKMKEKSVREQTYVHVVFQFLSEMEKIYAMAKYADDFKIMLDAATKMLDEKMKVFDPHVKMEIVWNDAENWDKLRATGVKIVWSGSHIDRYPGKQTEEYIDITQALLEDLGMLGEE